MQELTGLRVSGSIASLGLSLATAMFVRSSEVLLQKCVALDAVLFNSFYTSLCAGGSGADRPAGRTERRPSMILQYNQTGGYYRDKRCMTIALGTKVLLNQLHDSLR